MVEPPGPQRILSAFWRVIPFSHGSLLMTEGGVYRCAAVPLYRRIAVPPSRLAAVPLCCRPAMPPTRYVWIYRVTIMKYSGIFYTIFKLKALIGKANLTQTVAKRPKMEIYVSGNIVLRFCRITLNLTTI